MDAKTPKLRKVAGALEVVVADRPFKVVERIDVDTMREWKRIGEVLRILNPPVYEQLATALAEYAVIEHPTDEENARYEARLQAIKDSL